MSTLPVYLVLFHNGPPKEKQFCENEGNTSECSAPHC